MKNVIVIALLTAAVVTPAFADEPAGYFYAGADLGRTNTDTGAIMTKSHGTAYGAMVGYHLNPYFGTEVFYERVGDFSGTNAFGTATGTGKANALGVVAIGSIPLSNSFALIGKLGIARTKTTDTGNSAFGPIDIGASRTAATFGAGVLYNVTPKVGLRLGWDRFGAARHDFHFAPSTGNVLGVSQNFNTDVYALAALFKF